MLVIQRDGGEERSAEEAPENMLQVAEGKGHGGVLNSSLGGRHNNRRQIQDYALKRGGVRKFTVFGATKLGRVTS